MSTSSVNMSNPTPSPIATTSRSKSLNPKRLAGRQEQDLTHTKGKTKQRASDILTSQRSSSSSSSKRTSLPTISHITPSKVPVSRKATKTHSANQNPLIRRSEPIIPQSFVVPAPVEVPHHGAKSQQNAKVEAIVPGVVEAASIIIKIDEGNTHFTPITVTGEQIDESSTSNSDYLSSHPSHAASSEYEYDMFAPPLLFSGTPSRRLSEEVKPLVSSIPPQDFWQNLSLRYPLPIHSQSKTTLSSAPCKDLLDLSDDANAFTSSRRNSISSSFFTTPSKVKNVRSSSEESPDAAHSDDSAEAEDSRSSRRASMSSSSSSSSPLYTPSQSKTLLSSSPSKDSLALATVEEESTLTRRRLDFSEEASPEAVRIHWDKEQLPALPSIELAVHHPLKPKDLFGKILSSSEIEEIRKHWRTPSFSLGFGSPLRIPLSSITKETSASSSKGAFAIATKLVKKESTLMPSCPSFRGHSSQQEQDVRIHLDEVPLPPLPSIDLAATYPIRSTDRRVSYVGENVIQSFAMLILEDAVNPVKKEVVQSVKPMPLSIKEKVKVLKNKYLKTPSSWSLDIDPTLERRVEQHLYDWKRPVHPRNTRRAIEGRLRVAKRERNIMGQIKLYYDIDEGRVTI